MTLDNDNNSGRQSRLILLGLLILALNACDQNVPLGADQIYVNGLIYTADPADRVQEAFAVNDGIIVAVGSDAVIEGYRGENTLLVDFEHVTHWSIEKPIILALPYGVSWATFIGFNWLIPNARVPFRSAFWAGTLTAVLFELAKIGFAAYVSHVSYYHVLYGALSVIPLFLIWLYVSWLIILGGAIFCCLLTENQ